MSSVNLIPMRRRQARLLRARRKAWMVAASLFAVLLSAGYGAWRVAWSQDGQDFSHQLALLHSDIDEGAKSVARTRAAVRDAQLILRANHSVNGQPDWSLLLALIARLKGDEVVLNRLGLDVSAKTAGLPVTAAAGASDPASPAALHLQGYGRSQGAVAQFALGLERTGLFDSVSLVKTNREAFLGSEAVAFRLECQLKAVSAEPAPAKPKLTAPGKPAGRGAVADVADDRGNAP